MISQSNNENKAGVPPPYMNTLTSCVNKVVKDGYIDNFKITDAGLFSYKTEKSYQPNQITIINFYRFEGQSDPADNAILYVVETDDGSKGTIIDAYGPYSDAKLTAFINKVEEISKKEQKSDKPD